MVPMRGHMRELTWFNVGDAIDDIKIRSAESQLGVVLPKDYVSMIGQNSGGGNPDECEFKYQVRGKSRIGNFGCLISLDPEVKSNVFSVIRILEGRIPALVVPIVETGSGDFVCLDFRKGSDASVVYFSHEIGDEDAIVPVASTFSDFVDSLTVPGDL